MSASFVGVDVGTGSARAGVFRADGGLLGEAAFEIRMRTPAAKHFEQSSEDVWQACCKAVRAAVAAAGVSSVSGIAFDATCSLVVLGDGGRPLAVGADLPDDPAASSDCPPEDLFNIVVWCDHRAAQQAEAINAGGHRLLQHVGGAVSPEMEMPKLAWLKQRRPRTYAAASRFLDLADYLTCRAADGIAGSGKEGRDVRSICTLVCKWNFDAAARRWDQEFLASAGLADLGAERIGQPIRVLDVGSPVPGGLGAAAAADLGLSAGTPLGVGIIDAHAGGVGCLGGDTEGFGSAAKDSAEPLPLAARLALIAGTSACHMASSAQPVFVPGVWGPYASAMVPQLHLNEGGQSAAGALLDFLIESHAARAELAAAAELSGRKRAEVLGSHIEALAQQLPHAAFLTAGTFVGPDVNGNRSPLADPCLRGSVVGLGATAAGAGSLDSLSTLYLAAIQALAYSTRSIVEAINSARRQSGVEPIRALFATGGLAGNQMYLREHADALGLPVFLPKDVGAGMLLGSAMLAATAAGAFPSVVDAMSGMGQIGGKVEPCPDASLRRYHDARYEIFVRMQRHQQEYRALEVAALSAAPR